MNQIFNGRFLALVALVLLVATVLSGCGGCGSQVQVTASEVTNESIVVAKNELGEGAQDASLTATQLNSIAQLLASSYSTTLDTREILVAAYRGYDMLATDFDDSKVDPSVVGEANLDAAKKLIQKANDSVKDDRKISVDYGTLNKTDLLVLVNAFKTNVSLTEEGELIDSILTAIGKVLNWLTATLGFGSYILGICIFAIIIEVLMLPFAIKQQKHSVRQAELRPKEMAIRNRYKNRNDQASMQKMQQEIQEFYQKEHFSPYSSCLQLFLQIPIIMALYSIVIDPLHYVLGQASTLSNALSTYYTTARAAGGFGGALQSTNGTIEMLSALRNGAIESFEGMKSFAFFGNGGDVFARLAELKESIPNFGIGGVNFGLSPSFEKPTILLLVPVLTFAVYFFSSKITRKLMNSQPAASNAIEARQMACSNTMMDVMMPAMSTYFTFVVPAIIGVYWVFRCLLNMLKQFIMAKAMPLPVFTEEDYKAAAREMAGKKTIKKSENVGKVRSLHRIDDEDFEDTREKALARKAAIEEREREEQKKQAKSSPVAPAPIKKDEKAPKEQKEEVVEAEVAVEPTEAEQAQETNENNVIGE